MYMAEDLEEKASVPWLDQAMLVTQVLSSVEYSAITGTSPDLGNVELEINILKGVDKSSFQLPWN